MQIGIGIGLTNSRGLPTPQQFLGASLLGYWDAERQDTLSLSGSSVTTWTDLVGGYAATQGTAASKPTYAATSFNGRPGITFDGVAHELTLASVPFPIGASPAEIWVLVDQTANAAGTTTRRLFTYGGNGNLTSRNLTRIVDTGVNRAQMSSNNVDGPNGSVDFSGRHVVRGIVTATTTQVDVDGTAGTPVAVVSSTLGTRTRIGASTADSPGGFFQGVMSAILVTSPLSAAQAAQLLAYLKARGGVA